MDYWRMMEEERQHIARFEGRFRHPSQLDDALFDRANAQGGASPAQLSGVMLDNSTISLVQDFIYDNPEKLALLRGPVRRREYASALNQFLSALVLHERIYIGPEANMGLKIFSPSTEDALRLVTILESELPEDQRFLAVSLARQRSLHLVRRKPIVDLLSKIAGSQLDTERLTSLLDAIEPRWNISPDQIQDDNHYYGILANDILLRTLSAQYAVDPANAGRAWWQWHQFVPHGTSTYPQEHLASFFASHYLYRTVLYSYLADLTGLTYRTTRARGNLLRAVHEDDRRLMAEVLIRRSEGRLRRREEEMNQMLGFQAFKVRTPLLLHAIASKARDRDDLVRIALDLRVSRPARRFREYCTSIDEAIAAGDLTGMEGAITELSKIGIRLSDVVSGESTSDQRLNGFLEIAHSAPPLARSLAVLMRVPLLSMERWFRRRRFTLLDELASAPRWESPVEHELLASWTR